VRRLFLLFDNRSDRAGTVCVFQTDPGLGLDGVTSLAWLTKRVEPTTRVAFTWEVAYSFVWYDSGALGRGLSCVASQQRPASLAGCNQIALTREGHGFSFGEPTRGPEAGSLYVEQDGTIPLDRVAVGLGMAGRGTLVVPAQPNLTYRFTAPDPEYWIAFGEFQPGEPLDPPALAVPVARVAFPDNVCAMTATLDQRGRWSVQPTE
jgi:hypothetical protein